MNGSKSVFASLGIMGPLSGLIVMLLNNFVFKGSIITEADMIELVNQVSAVWGMVTGIIGRYRATKTIG